jgi:hypothetical protein
MGIIKDVGKYATAKNGNMGKETILPVINLIDWDNKH